MAGAGDPAIRPGQISSSSLAIAIFTSQISSSTFLRAVQLGAAYKKLQGYSETWADTEALSLFTNLQVQPYAGEDRILALTILGLLFSAPRCLYPAASICLSAGPCEACRPRAPATRVAG